MSLLLDLRLPVTYAMVPAEGVARAVEEFARTAEKREACVWPKQ